MLAKVYSGAVFGVDAYEVEIEVDAGHGEPKVVVVGLPDAAVKESSDRVWTALVNSGFTPPMGKTTVNLAQADIKKEGPSFDLPIALRARAEGRKGILVPPENAEKPPSSMDFRSIPWRTCAKPPISSRARRRFLRSR